MYLNNIRALRLAHRMTQEALADRIGVRKGAVSRWESGEDIPRADRAIRLAAALNCSLEELALDGKGCRYDS